jgi:hypothetical protein
MEIGTHLLDGAWAKMARAAQHLQLLDRLVDQYRAGDPVRLGIRPSRDGETFIAYLEAGGKPPLHLALVVGDIAGNLRSALDQAAWQLALRTLGEDRLSTDEGLARQITFPIQDRRTEWEKKRTALAERLGEDAIAAIEPLQPFNNEGTARVNPLALLQAINNTDKHRVRINSLAAIPLDGIQVTANGPLDLDGLRPLVPVDALVEAEMSLFEIPAPDAPTPSIRLRLIEAPPVCLLVEGVGVLRVDQLTKLAADVADVIGIVSHFFPPIDDLEDRLGKLVVPDVD